MNNPDERKQRSLSQNNSLHRYCTELATELQNSGVPLEVFVRDIEADYTMEAVKEVFRAFGRAKFHKKSTADLTTTEIQACYEEMNRHVSQFGIHMAWPSVENTEEFIRSYEKMK
jgi:hypothetical protein